MGIFLIFEFFIEDFSPIISNCDTSDNLVEALTNRRGGQSLSYEKR